MRTLLIFIALALIVMAVRQLLRKPPRRDTAARSMTGRMVQCARCGIFVPEDEALERDGLHYCSPEHRDATDGRS
jgi:uncharacterized protein